MRPQIESLQEALLVDALLSQRTLVVFEAMPYGKTYQLAIIVERLACDDALELDVSLFPVVVDLGWVQPRYGSLEDSL